MTTHNAMSLSSDDRPPTVKTQTLASGGGGGGGGGGGAGGGGKAVSSSSPRRHSQSSSDVDSVNTPLTRNNDSNTNGMKSGVAAQASNRSTHHHANPPLASSSGAAIAIGNGMQPPQPLQHSQQHAMAGGGSGGGSGGAGVQHTTLQTTTSQTPSAMIGNDSPASSFRANALRSPDKQSAMLAHGQHSQSSVLGTGGGGGAGGSGGGGVTSTTSAAATPTPSTALTMGGAGGMQLSFTALPSSVSHHHHSSSNGGGGGGGGGGDEKTAIHSSAVLGASPNNASPHSGRGANYLTSHPEDQPSQMMPLISSSSVVLSNGAGMSVGTGGGSHASIAIKRVPSKEAGGGGGNTISPKSGNQNSKEIEPPNTHLQPQQSPAAGSQQQPQSGGARPSVTPSAPAGGNAAGGAAGAGGASGAGFGRVTKHNLKDFDRKGAYVVHDQGVKDAEPNGFTLKLSSGVYGMQGARTSMEDKHSVLQTPDFNKVCNLDDGVPRSFFAVYDGHGGYVAAEYSRQHVHKNFVTDSMFGIQTEYALKNGLLKTEHDFCSACRKKQLLSSSGTCAVVAYIQGTSLVCANVGDSRCVLSSGTRSIPMSIDHKPARPDERERIEALGGRVGRTEDEAFGREAGASTSSGGGGCMCIKSMFSDEKPLRIFPGGLSVSRTIGDIALKATQLITAEPELIVRQLTVEDNAVILACDGVWDVMNDSQATELVRKYLDDPTKAARMLSFEAYRRGSKDNISVIVIALNWVKANNHHQPTTTNTNALST